MEHRSRRTYIPNFTLSVPLRPNLKKWCIPSIWHHFNFPKLALVAFIFASTTLVSLKLKTFLTIGNFSHFFLNFFNGLSTVWSFGWDLFNCPLLEVCVPSSISSSFVSSSSYSSSQPKNLKLFSNASLSLAIPRKLKTFFAWPTPFLCFWTRDKWSCDFGHVGGWWVLSKPKWWGHLGDVIIVANYSPPVVYIVGSNLIDPIEGLMVVDC